MRTCSQRPGRGCGLGDGPMDSCVLALGLRDCGAGQRLGALGVQGAFHPGE